MPCLRFRRFGRIPPALVYEVPLAVVAVVELPVAEQPSAPVVGAVPAVLVPVDVPHQVGSPEDAVEHAVFPPPYEVSHRVVVSRSGYIPKLSIIYNALVKIFFVYSLSSSSSSLCKYSSNIGVIKIKEY